MKRLMGLFSFVFLLAAQAQAFSDDNYTAALHYFNQGYWTKAAKYFTRVTQSDPDNWRAYEGLGDCEFHLRHREEAMVAYQMSLTLNPQNKLLQDFVDDQKSMPPPPLPPEEPQAIPGSTNAVPAPPFPTLPRINSFDVRLSLGSGLSSADDFNAFYGLNNAPSGSQYGTTARLNLGMALDYTVSPNFQLGAGFTALIKNPLSITGQSGGVTETDQWHEQAVGGELEARFLLPAPSGNIIFAGQIGYYSLYQSSVDITQTDGFSTASGTVNLEASNFGGTVQIEYEPLLSLKMKMDFGLGYRLLRFSPITAVGSGGSATLTNPDGGKSWIDFSGPELTWSLIFI